MPRPYHPPWFYHLNNIWWRIKLWGLSLRSRSLLLPLRSKYFPEHPVLSQNHNINIYYCLLICPLKGQNLNLNSQCRGRWIIQATEIAVKHLSSLSSSKSDHFSADPGAWYEI
jgi:hypothetical protein